MSDSRVVHLVERAVERMAALGGTPAAIPAPPPVPAATVAPLIAPPVATPVPPIIPPVVPVAIATARSANDPAIPAAPPSGGGATAEPVSMAALEAAGLAVAGARRSQIAEEWRVTAGQLLRTMHALRPGSAIGHGNGSGNGAAAPNRIVAGNDGRGDNRPDNRTEYRGDRGDRRDGVAANLLMVTSSKPNEGKSFSSLNLAGSLALGGLAEVLLMDIDSKPGALTEILGLAGRPGLFDLVADPALRPEDVVLATAIPGLSILPIGRVAAGGPGSSDRTVTRPVAAMVERLARRFSSRIVVLDSAPCLATSDASTLAPSVGQIAMIVEAERTQRDDLEAALELLRPCPNITLILNKVRLVTTHAFGDYHYYDA